jgi:hypothetical protein
MEGGVGHVRAKWLGGWRFGDRDVVASLGEPLIGAFWGPLDGPRLVLDLVSARRQWTVALQFRVSMPCGVRTA